jgi:hypothetical protein
MGCENSGMIPKEADLGALKNFYSEFYKRHFPCRTYRVVRAKASQPEYDTFYREVHHYEQRVYDDFSLPLIFSMEPEDFLHLTYGIDVTRQVVFTAAKPILDQLGITPKAGDQILFDDKTYEVRTSKRKAESYFASLNYCFELAIVADMPNPGS